MTPARVPTSSTTSGAESFGKGPNQLLDPGQRVLAQPFDDITVGRQELELAVPLDRLAGAAPRY